MSICAPAVMVCPSGVGQRERDGAGRGGSVDRGDAQHLLAEVGEDPRVDAAGEDRDLDGHPRDRGEDPLGERVGLPAGRLVDDVVQAVLLQASRRR
jgi:hypothetical protein